MAAARLTLPQTKVRRGVYRHFCTGCGRTAMRDGQFGSRNNANYCSPECFQRYRRLMQSKALITSGANLRQIMAQAPADYWPELSSVINTDGSINNGSGGGGSFLALDGSTEMAGDIVIAESADHGSTPAAGKGYIWVKSDTPSSLYFTADDGTDYDLTAPSASGDEIPLFHQFRFHQGSATFATAQEETITETRGAMTIQSVHVSVTRTGGTGTSSATSYWRVRIYNGGSAAGSLVATYQSHDGVSTADDMTDQFDVKVPTVSNASVSDATNITMQVFAETSGGAPVSLNSEAFKVVVFATYD